MILHKPTPTDQFACVYLIKNPHNGMIYVGQASKFYNRYIGHRKGKHGKRIKDAMHEYGFLSFDFYILERAPVEYGFVEKKKWLTEREQHYLDELKPFGEIGYNICEAADSTVGYKHTEESKEKLRAARKIQMKNGWFNPTLGTTRPEHVKNAVSKANKGKITHRRRVKQLNKETGEVIKIWDSASEAARFLGIAITQISAVALKRPKFTYSTKKWFVPKSAGGFGWEYDGGVIVGRQLKDDIKSEDPNLKEISPCLRSDGYLHKDGDSGTKEKTPRPGFKY